MDTNIMMSIIKHSEEALAMTLIKAGGKEYFEAAKSLGIIRKIKLDDDHQYFEISFRFTSDAQRIYRLTEVCEAFEVTRFMNCMCAECIATFKENKKAMKQQQQQHPHNNNNATHIFVDRAYNFIDIISTNRESFFRGLLKLDRMSKMHQLRVTTDVGIYVGSNIPQPKFINVEYNSQILPTKINQDLAMINFDKLLFAIQAKKIESMTKRTMSSLNTITHPHPS